MKGLHLEIYKENGRDYSNGGISNRTNTVTLIGDDVPEIFEADENAPAVRIVTRWAGTDREYKHVEPVEPKGAKKVGYMCGGCLVYSSDSSFRRLSQYPLSFHDRTETQKEYDTLSR